MVANPLRLEITLAKAGEWRVVERGHSATENVSRISFSNEELSELLVEINHCLLDVNITLELQRIRLRRLGSRLAEMVLPVRLKEMLASAVGAVEFYLDDTTIMLPVELFPNGNTVLAEALPVSRHWFCENAITVQEESSVTGKHALVVADPAENLPGAQNEGAAVFRRIRSMGKGWGCRFLGRTVSRAELARELPDTTLLHLATHYSVGDSRTEQGLVLADGIWMPSASSHTPEIVFANCCRAGLTTGLNGELSLVGRFLKQGTRHVIAPFLPASDMVGEQFANAFYQSFFSGKSVALAVWEARKTVGPASWVYWYFGAFLELKNKPKRIGLKLSVLCIFIFICTGAAIYGWKYHNFLNSGNLTRNSISSDGNKSEDLDAPIDMNLSKEENIPPSDPYDELREYLSLKDVDDSDYTEFDVFQIAENVAEIGDIRALEMLIDHGVSPNRRFGLAPFTILQRAVLYEQHEAAKWLLEHGGDPNARSIKGDTTMHMAAFNADIEMLDLLYSYGGDINATERLGRAPAHYAVLSRKTEPLNWLKDKGANLDKIDRECITPLWIAYKEDADTVIKWFKEEMNLTPQAPGDIIWERY